MAAGTTLKLKFGTAYGEKTFSYKYGNTEATTASIKACMQSFITNGDIFRYPPLTAISAVAEVTTSTEWDLS